MKNELKTVIGYSGHAYVVIQAAKLLGFEFGGYCDKNPRLKNPYNLEYLGYEEDDNFNWQCLNEFVLAIGDNHIRHKAGKLISSKKKHLLNIVHPSSFLCNTVTMGQGNFISSNVVVNAFATIGDFCILNSSSTVEHECVINDGVHIAPGAVLAGNVKIGENSFVGANSVVKQGLNIGKNVIIGAGSVVLRDIPDGQVWIGNPAKELRK